MDVVRLPDAESVAAEVARRLAAASGPVVLAGGTSPMRAYELASELREDWTGVHLFYGDERCVASDHPDSNHGQAAARLQAPGATWHPMDGAAGPEAGAAAYAREIAGVAFGLVLLGMGPDGHTLSLFPEHPALEAIEPVAGIDDSPKPPPERITLTLPGLEPARELLLIVTGAEKAEALARVFAGPDRHTPASLLDRDRLTVVADAAALGPDA